MNEMLLVAIVVILAAISWLDLVWRWIPNTLVAAVALLWIPTAFTAPFMNTVASASTAATILSIGVVVWRLGWLGGGDVKLIAALSLWAGPALTPGLLLAIGVSGGVLAAVVLAARQPMLGPLRVYLHVAIHHYLPASTRSLAATVPYRLPARSGNDTIPYGVAVAAGGCWLAHRLFVG